MIEQLHGIIHQIKDQSVTLMCGPIGFELFIANPSNFKSKETVDLFIHMHWNQDQGPTLYAFRTRDEKMVFCTIIACPGIGPKLALAIFEHCGAQAFVYAIAEENSKTLSNIPGIGKKKAEQLIVQLKDKVAKLIGKGITITSGNLSQLQEISEVLGSLNYSRIEITSTLEHLKKTDRSDISFDALLRTALSYLSKRPQ
jgi:holliday junction DNA helicase RuvA